jgi:hypothetical protein
VRSSCAGCERTVLPQLGLIPWDALGLGLQKLEPLCQKRSDDLFCVSYCLPKAYRESPEGQALLRKIEETIADKRLTFAKVVDLHAYVEQACQRCMRNPDRPSTPMTGRARDFARFISDFEKVCPGRLDHFRCDLAGVIKDKWLTPEGYKRVLNTIRELLPNDLRKKHGLTLSNYGSGTDSIERNFSPGDDLRPKSVERLIEEILEGLSSSFSVTCSRSSYEIRDPQAPATERQLHFIKELHGNAPTGLTKSAASQMIDKLLSEPSPRQHMELRFLGLEALVSPNRTEIAILLDAIYREHPEYKAAWETWKCQNPGIDQANDWYRVPIGTFYHLNISHNALSTAIPEIENPFKILSEPFPTSTKRPWWKFW